MTIYFIKKNQQNSYTHKTDLPYLTDFIFRCEEKSTSHKPWNRRKSEKKKIGVISNDRRKRERSFTKFSPEETTTPRSRDNKLPGFEVRAFAKITLQL